MYSSFRSQPKVDKDTHSDAPQGLRYQRDPMRNQIQLYYSSFSTATDLKSTQERYVPESQPKKGTFQRLDSRKVRSSVSTQERYIPASQLKKGTFRCLDSRKVHYSISTQERNVPASQPKKGTFQSLDPRKVRARV